MNAERDIERDDAVKGIISDYLDKEAKDHKRLEKAAAGRRKLGRLRSYFRAAGALAILILSGYVIFLLLPADVLGGENHWAVGKESRMDAKTEECIGRMWKIRGAIDAYYEKSKEYPDVLKALYGDYLGKRYGVCPASGAPYVFGERDGRTVFACPNPGEHGLLAIWCDVKGGPPAIERE